MAEQGAIVEQAEQGARVVPAEQESMVDSCELLRELLYQGSYYE